MTQASEILRWLSVGIFVALGVLSSHRWRVTRQRPGAWAAATFTSLAVVALIGVLMPRDLDPDDIIWVVRSLIVVLLLFPYLLYRFAASIVRPPAWAERLATGSTIALIAFTMAVSHFPRAGEPREGSYLVYTLAVVAQWLFLFAYVGQSLWRAGRGKPTLVRRRLRWMAVGSIGMNVAVVMRTIVAGRDPSVIGLAGQAVALFCGVALLIGLAPPRILRTHWRHWEDGAAQSLMLSLMSAETPGQVATTILPFLVEVLGVHGVALTDASGSVIGNEGVSLDTVQQALSRRDQVERARVFTYEGRFCTMLCWTDEYRPFFAPDDDDLMQAFGITTDLVLERCAKLAYERRFIANAAHELRTPLTTLSGLSVTLATRRHQMSEPEIDECFAALERQGERTRVLIQNLLDLAQLEHGTPDVHPRAVAVAEVARRALEAAPPPEGRHVDVRIDDAVTALAEDSRLEQVIVNLLTNAYRYGGPSITVEAFSDVGGVLVVVSDDGEGVPSELLPQLFEPFGRGSVGSNQGSGLGLAIVRKLVTAHGGDVWYEPARPRGARFTIKLPRAA